MVPAFTLVSSRPPVAWRAGVLAAAGVAAAGVLGWLAADVSAPRLAAGVVALGCAGAALGWAAARRPELHWTGEVFRLGRDEAAPVARVAVALDLGALLLLRVRTEGAPATRLPAWVPVSAAELGDGAHALRCAIRGARGDD